MGFEHSRSEQLPRMIADLRRQWRFKTLVASADRVLSVLHVLVELS